MGTDAGRGPTAAGPGIGWAPAPGGAAMVDMATATMPTAGKIATLSPIRERPVTIAPLVGDSYATKDHTADFHWSAIRLVGADLSQTAGDTTRPFLGISYSITDGSSRISLRAIAVHHSSA